VSGPSAFTSHHLKHRPWKQQDSVIPKPSLGRVVPDREDGRDSRTVLRTRFCRSAPITSKDPTTGARAESHSLGPNHRRSETVGACSTGSCPHGLGCATRGQGVRRRGFFPIEAKRRLISRGRLRGGRPTLDVGNRFQQLGCRKGFLHESSNSESLELLRRPFGEGPAGDNHGDTLAPHPNGLD